MKVDIVLRLAMDMACPNQALQAAKAARESLALIVPLHITTGAVMVDPSQILLGGSWIAAGQDIVIRLAKSVSLDHCGPRK